MIKYTPFWDLMRKKGISQYALTTHYNISSETIHRLRNNKPVSLQRIDDLCKIFTCRVEDVIVYENDGD